MADTASSLLGYLSGYDTGIESSPAYLTGIGYTTSTHSAYSGGALGTRKTKKFCYLAGLMRTSLNCYVGGVIVAVPYIWLKTSDNGITSSKKFRVLAQDYDDGTKERSETVEKTLGGGIDHSVGSIYTTWAPIIRVRAQETETDYGNKDDLEFFYELSNPNGVPSNDITFVDNRQMDYIVHFVGRMTKNLMGCEIEGTEAWYLYRLQMIKVS